MTIDAITYEFVSYILPISTKSKQRLHFRIYFFPKILYNNFRIVFILLVLA